MTDVLIAGVGNIFAGDDAFGVEVARRLAQRALPRNTRVVDFGNRAIDLVYALLDDCDAAVLVDAAARGGPPGTLYVIEPEPSQDSASAVALSHELDPGGVLRMLGSARGRCQRVYIVGCEPQTLGDEFHGAMGLSEPVEQAVERAASLAATLAAQLAGDLQ